MSTSAQHTYGGSRRRIDPSETTDADCAVSTSTREVLGVNDWCSASPSCAVRPVLRRARRLREAHGMGLGSAVLRANSDVLIIARVFGGSIG
jgi:hypothetical protein